MNLQEAGEDDIDPAERIGLLSSAAKNIATLARASVNQKKFRLEIQARAEAAAANVEKIAKKGGLSAESVDALRREILGIAG
ncbi:phage protein Gp27 family protein [Pandoraea norimbergensis]|uniref:phage protein Gp27 family protein n=1 Tax=Pandoraea norimbergensis TaxID=93219 RepID=UPI00202A76D0|nr:phage protein Gp27 family protein [Pandoraea norimbergensis]